MRIEEGACEAEHDFSDLPQLKSSGLRANGVPPMHPLEGPFNLRSKAMEFSVGFRFLILLGSALIL